MSSHAHPASTLGASRKRKDRDGSDPPRNQMSPKFEPNSSAAAAAAAARPALASNRLLAGFLAHEFLTKGTLFGRRWEPGRSEPGRSPEPPVRAEPDPAKPPRAYAEVSQMLKAEGVHIPGVVNPTQLARWLKM